MNEKIKIKTTIYSTLINNWYKYLEFKNQAEKLKYKAWDFLVIKNWILSIYKTNIVKDTTNKLNTHKEKLKPKKYNNNLLDYKKSLTHSQIKETFIVFWKYEQKIENKKPQILNYFIENISKQINLSWNWYLIYVDKGLQRSFLIKFDNNKITIDWYVKVSTWNPKRWYDKRWNKYWNTPSVIIPMEKWFWRSSPDKWENYWWYWKRWSRVFSLNNLKYNKKTKKFDFSNINNKDIWFAMHKTSFAWKKNIWKKMSHWCIRAEDLMIDLLDNIERNNKLGFRYTIIWDYKNNIIPYIPKIK